MKQWCLFGWVMLIAGCGEQPVTNRTSTELDGEVGTEQKQPGLGVNLDELKQSPLFHEFDVDLFNADPIQRADTFTFSSNDTYKISLKTLDFLAEPKRFSLVKANTISQKGIPKVIAPLGYKVTVRVEGTEVVAEIQSTTQPKAPPTVVPVTSGSEDIVVGDTTSLELQGLSLQKDVSFSVSTLGLRSDVHGFNRNLTYYSGQWMAQASQQNVGKYTLISVQTGVMQTIREVGTLGLSIQGIYRLHDAAYVNVLAFKYTYPLADALGQWHVGASYTLNADTSVAFGMGWTGKLGADSKISVGVVKSKLEASFNVLLTLNP